MSVQVWPKTRTVKFKICTDSNFASSILKRQPSIFASFEAFPVAEEEAQALCVIAQPRRQRDDRAAAARQNWPENRVVARVSFFVLTRICTNEA